MSDRTLTVAFVGGALLALVGGAVYNAITGGPTTDMLDKAMILAAALLPSPLSKTTTAGDADGTVPVNVQNTPEDPVQVEGPAPPSRQRKS